MSVVLGQLDTQLGHRSFAIGQQPLPEQFPDDETMLMRLPALLIRQYADRVAVDTVDNRQRVSLHFEH